MWKIQCFSRRNSRESVPRAEQQQLLRPSEIASVCGKNGVRFVLRRVKIADDGYISDDPLLCSGNTIDEIGANLNADD